MYCCVDAMLVWIRKPQNNTNKLTDWCSGRPATPMICEVKMTVFVNGVWWLWRQKAVKYSKYNVHLNWYWYFFRWLKYVFLLLPSRADLPPRQTALSDVELKLLYHSSPPPHYIHKSSNFTSRNAGVHSTYNTTSKNPNKPFQLFPNLQS